MISAVLLLLCLQKEEDKVERYIYAVALWMLYCFSMTEILSIFTLLTRKNLFLSWLLADISLLACVILRWKKSEKSIRFNQVRSGLFENKKKLGIAFIWNLFAAGIMFLAISTNPYNWDSMTYHLARLFHFAQNQSVDYYATWIDRQVASPVGAAYVNLHVYILSGKRDIFVNLLQCCSYLTNGVLIFYITKKLKCSVKYCYIALILFYTMPIAFAEALTTQVDNFSALWMLSVIYLLLDLLQVENKLLWDKRTFKKVIILALCVGFGYLTKPSIGFGLLFFAIWLLCIVIKRKDSIRVISSYFLISVSILGFLLLPGFCRNMKTFEALSAPNVGARQLIGTLEPKYVLVNALKNITFNLPMNYIFDSDAIYQAVTSLADKWNVDIDAHAISEDGSSFFIHSPQTYGHDTAVNPLITYLTIIFILLFLVSILKRSFQDMKNGYFMVAVSSFIAFCAVLRWEPYVSRYMLSYLAVLCPAVVGQMELFFETSRKVWLKRVGSLCCILVLLLSLAEMKGLLQFHLDMSEKSNYYLHDWAVREEYQKVEEYLGEKGLEEVGLIMGGNTYEYPLTVELRNTTRIEHVNVANATGMYEDDSYIPEVILSIESGVRENEIICHGITFEKSLDIGEDIVIYEPVAYADGIN